MNPNSSFQSDAEGLPDSLSDDTEYDIQLKSPKKSYRTMLIGFAVFIVVMVIISVAVIVPHMDSKGPASADPADPEAPNNCTTTYHSFLFSGCLRRVSSS